MVHHSNCGQQRRRRQQQPKVSSVCTVWQQEMVKHLAAVCWLLLATHDMG